MSAKAVFRLSLLVGAFAALALGAFADAPISVADEGAHAPPPNFGAFDETDPTAFGFGFSREDGEDDEGALGASPPFAGGDSPFDAIPDGAGVLAPPPPVPFADALPTDGAPSAVSDDLAPGVFGKKSAQTYQNLTGALDGIAGVADANAGKGAECA